MASRCHDIRTEDLDFLDALVFEKKLLEQVTITELDRW